MTMKKMMIIAALVSGMLMPAQLSAKENKRNDRKPVAARVENKKGGNRKDMHVQSAKPAPAPRPTINSKPSHKPQAVHHAPAPRPVVVHHTPAPAPVVVHHSPVPAPPPAPVVHHHCKSEAAGVAAVAVGLVGLISLLAN